MEKENEKEAEKECGRHCPDCPIKETIHKIGSV